MLSSSERRELLSLLLEQERRISRRKIESFYPDEGPLRRELYVKHLEFFRLGRSYKQRLALCANRVGKSEGMGGFEIACHATGIYPTWWEGFRFSKPVTCWVAGETAKLVRDSIQLKLCGPINAIGTGLLRGDSIVRFTPKGGVPDCIDTIHVESAHGGQSTITFKSYDQGRESFQAAEVDVLLLDEEPPLSVYAEAVTRTMTTRGLVLLTFTPLLGMSDTVLQFLPNGEVGEYQQGTRAVIMATWDHAPHLTDEMKTAMLETYPPYQRDARSKGIPQLGSGAIYPIEESSFLVEPFEIPAHWPRVYGFDVGWNKTAAIWLAHDRESQTVYAYSEHYRGHAEPSVHASAIKARGEWIPGTIDPAARGRGQADGRQLLQDYRDLGLQLTEAENAVEAGIYQVYERMSGGRLKVFRTLQNFLSEFRLYRRDDKGRIVKVNDHLLDGLRYAIVSGLSVAAVNLPKFSPPAQFASEFG